ncbi:AMP-binding protein [Aldersonia kunmingensis]|uniref:AMP-binding protein n=1 Tax=Aldersonia kunmingensis TaxID=408066 RepID=UPI003CCB8009
MHARGVGRRRYRSSSLPLYHCAQLDNFLITDIYLGATSIILDRPDPAAILAAVERYGATNLFCPPTVWIALLHELEGDSRTIPSLRKGYYGRLRFPSRYCANSVSASQRWSCVTSTGRPRWARSPQCSRRRNRMSGRAVQAGRHQCRDRDRRRRRAASRRNCR